MADECKCNKYDKLQLIAVTVVVWYAALRFAVFQINIYGSSQVLGVIAWTVYYIKLVKVWDILGVDILLF